MDERTYHGLFDERSVVQGMTATSRDEVLARLIDACVGAGRIEPSRRDGVLDAVRAREELGSTGIGGGIAIPHAKTDLVDSIVTAVGVARQGIDFKSVDGEACGIFFLLLSPKAEHEAHLAILRWLSRLKRNPDFSRLLRSAPSPRALIATLEVLGR